MGVAARQLRLGGANRGLIVQGLAGVALVAQLAVLAVGLLVQRDFLAPARLPEILGLWGRVALLGTAVWIATMPFAAPRPAAAAVGTATLTPTRRRIGAGLLAFAVVAIGLGLGQLVDDLGSPIAGWFWLLGILALLGAVLARELSLPRWQPRAWLRRQGLWDWLGHAVVAFSFVVRLIWPNTSPAFFNWDEAMLSVWAIPVMHHQLVPGEHAPAAISPFQTTTYVGAPMGGFYLYGLSMQVFGETFAGLHVLSGICGGLTVWVVYRLLREHTRPWSAVLGAFLLTINGEFLFWTRTGIQLSPLVLLMSVVVWQVLRGARGRGYLPWVVAGVSLGAGTYFYWAPAAFVPILGVFFLYMLARERGSFFRLYLPRIVAMALCAIVTFAPLGIWYVGHPSTSTERASFILSDAGNDLQGPDEAKPTGLQLLEKQIERNVGGVAVSGDPAPPHYPIGQPLIDPLVGALTLAGLFGFTLTIRRPEHLLVALWFWVPALVVALFTDRPPAMSRLTIVIPAFFLLIGFIVDRISALVERVGGWTIFASLAPFVLVGVVYAGYWDLERFFVMYPTLVPRNKWTEMMRTSNEAGPSYKTYSLGGDEFGFQREEVRGLAWFDAGETLDPKLLPVPDRGFRNGLFVVPPDQPGLLAKLQQLYPGGAAEERDDNLGKIQFWAYKVPAATLFAAAPADSPYLTPDVEMGRSGSRYGEVISGASVAAGPDGRVYVADIGRDRIVAYDASGEPVASYGRMGTGNGEFKRLEQVALAPDGLVLGFDGETGWVQRFARDGRWLGKLGGTGAIKHGTGLAVEADGSIVVADAAGPAVLRFAPDGTLLGRADGAALGLRSIAAIARGPDGTLLVAEVGTGQVVRLGPELDRRGELRLQLPPGKPEQGLSMAVGDDGAIYAAVPTEGTVWRYSATGQREWEVRRARANEPAFVRPVFLATDAAGSLYVLNGEAGMVFRYDVQKRVR